jgi:protein TonB
LSSGGEPSAIYPGQIAAIEVGPLPQVGRWCCVFENLIESQPRKERTLVQTVTSVALHTLLILVAIKATQGAAEAVQKLNQAPADFILPPEPPPPPPPPEEIPPDVVVTNNPPPQGFQTLVPPKDLPTEIPPIDLNEKFDARDFSGRGVEGGVGTGVIGGTGPVLDDDVITGTTYSVSDVDDPAVRTGGPSPEYPEIMRTVGIDGVVRLRFVVGTDGRAESGSITVVSSTNKAFDRNAIDAIRKSTFKPAKIAGRPVRQLVEQNIRFALDG